MGSANGFFYLVGKVQPLKKKGRKARFVIRLSWKEKNVAREEDRRGNTQRKTPQKKKPPNDPKPTKKKTPPTNTPKKKKKKKTHPSNLSALRRGVNIEGLFLGCGVCMLSKNAVIESFRNSRGRHDLEGGGKGFLSLPAGGKFVLELPKGLAR